MNAKRKPQTITPNPKPETLHGAVPQLGAENFIEKGSKFLKIDAIEFTAQHDLC